MDTTELLRDAWKAVDQAALPEHVHAAALRVAAENLLRSLPETMASGDTQHDPATLPSGGSIGFLAAIAHKLKVDPQAVEHVYNQEGDMLEIVVAPGKLAKKSSTATKRLAILTVAGRQGAGLEEWTTASLIREWCEHFKRLDSPNFAAALKELESLFTMRGSPRARQMKMTAPGWVEAARLVAELGGSEVTHGR